MERIGTKSIGTGKHCVVCKQEVTEVIFLQDGEAVAKKLFQQNYPEMRWLDSYISCPHCSIPYGKPSFTSVLPTMSQDEKEDLKWELSLYEVKVKVTPTVKDFNFFLGMDLAITDSDLLQKFPVGTTVYIDDSGTLAYMFQNYKIIRLSKDKTSQVFAIKTECFE